MFTKKNQPVSSSNITLISTGCRFEGKFKIEGSMQLDGELDGQLNCAEQLLISQSGHFSGILVAGHLIVEGKLTGECHANRIDIMPSGSVNGTIYSNALSIENGGRFLGDVQPAQKNESVAALTS